MDNRKIASDLLFRKAEETDIERIWVIIGQAKEQMRRLNSHQWDESYPALETISQDIKIGNGYVFCKGNKVVAYGVISFDGEPVYKDIDGKWTNELPYMIVHRLAVADEMKRQGMAKRFMLEAEEVSRQKGIYNFRVDTNYDKEYMLHLIDSLGFQYTGEVRYRGNNIRKAFEKCIYPYASSFGVPGYTIREAIYEDAGIIFDAIDKNRDDLRAWLPFVDGLKSVDDEQSFLSSSLQVPYEERDIVYMIEKGKSICGLIGFHFSDRANHRTEIGYWLLPEYRGKGLVTRAVHHLCLLAFFEKGFNRIQIRCAVGNTASNAIPLGLGFTHEGTERDGELLITGKYTDINVYSILKEDIAK
ncbi:GNAT family N-acetyltransferase [Parabacteroides leei]|uniref:GNAT family N-acetyltransferase n=1 Tax=Parabacteroides leei TaxID=2939491 RepID=UPI0032422627